MSQLHQKAISLQKILIILVLHLLAGEWLTKLIQHTFAPILDHKYPLGDIWLWAVFLGWYLWTQVSWVPYPLPRLQWGNENEDDLMIFLGGRGNWHDTGFGNEIEATQTFSSLKSIKMEFWGIQFSKYISFHENHNVLCWCTAQVTRRSLVESSS